MNDTTHPTGAVVALEHKPRSKVTHHGVAKIGSEIGAECAVLADGRRGYVMRSLRQAVGFRKNIPVPQFSAFLAEIAPNALKLLGETGSPEEDMTNTPPRATVAHRPRLETIIPPIDPAVLHKIDGAAGRSWKRRGRWARWRPAPDQQAAANRLLAPLVGSVAVPYPAGG